MHIRYRCLFTMFICVLIAGTVASPVATAKEKPLNAKMEQIVTLINDGQWDRAQKEANALKKLYEKERWKLQLLGNEGEYGQIDQEVEKLQAAIQARDSAQSKIILSTVRSLLRNIYSL